MATKTRQKWTKSKQTSLATWIFGTLLFIFLIGVFVFAPPTLPEFKHRLLALLSALLAAFWGYFLTGDINIDIAKDSKLGQIAVKAAGGFALFVFVLCWWMSPLAPGPEKATVPTKPYEQMIAGSIRSETGAPVADVSVSIPEIGVTVKTDSMGRFELEITEMHQKTMEIMAQKDGYKPHEQYATLGNTTISFTMKAAK